MSHQSEGISAGQALRLLKVGNLAYVAGSKWSGDASEERRAELAAGQSPFAVIVACSDSRVVPEAIFACDLGDLFVIRVAGNVVDDHALGSIEYAVDHLGTNLVVVLGHTNCGAVGAALEAGEAPGHVASLVTDIRAAIGGETDPRAASILNAQAVAARIRRDVALNPAPTVLAALYDIHTGAVEWLD